MKKTLLLLAGCPGTGKSYLGKLICKAIPDFFNETSIDFFKEKLYDEQGFNNIEEKKQLDDQAYSLFYQSIETLMEKGKSIISDYPFSYRQHDSLQRLANQYAFQVITITLTCDPDVLYQRQRQRDLDPDRHLGFIMNHFHQGDTLPDRTKMDIQKTKAEFEKFNKIRDYENFSLGKTIFLNVSDFRKVEYDEVIVKVKTWLE
ncbi:AAA family ATPase [Lactobacillus xylocopicola]|uniref:Kinase n=1 Tax=Lactobacillus xylocopicola TaxID=2976676 RepID=A0ABN6SLS7_9LACO|nr:AAA family ATPase [Lactobacillus xylocopicola]BDR61174.1 kinase [Lactobacillus xylocopicola]